MLLRTIADQGGLELPRYFRVIRNADGTRMIVSGNSRNATRIARLAFSDDVLRISRVVSKNGKEEFEEVVSAGTDLLAGIEEGKLTPTLRFLLARAGTELPEQVDVRTLQEDREWSISANIGGVVQDFQLKIEGENLVAYKLIAPTDKHEADVVWKFDMMKELGVSQHNMATCTITSWEDTLFVCTSNGVDESHINIPAPEAPSFIAIDKHTGRLLWTDSSPGMNILHGQWSAPAVAVLGGVPQAIFCGGDGWVYSFRADRWRDEKPELLWKFDANPKDTKWILGGSGTRNNIVAIPVIYDGMVYVVMGQDPEHGEGQGHLWCIDPTKRGDVSPELFIDQSGKPLPHFRLHAAAEWGRIMFLSGQETLWEGVYENDLSADLRDRFRLAGVALPNEVTIEKAGKYRFVTAKMGGVTRRFRLMANIRKYGNQTTHNLTVDLETNGRVVSNPNSAVVWHYDRVDQDNDGEIDFEEEFHRGIGSVAIKNDLLFVSDFSGLVHCLDAKTGKPHWTCDMLAQCWGSPLIVEDKVYIGDEDGDMAIFKLSSDWTESAKETEVTGRDGATSTFYEPLHEIYMPSSIYSTPIVANDVLYIADKTHLFAIATSHEEEE
jgi:outer membrane protein assembly factor BamB